MKFSVGPILYYWSKKSVIEFYDEAKHAEVDIIYLGETVCAKRREMKYSDWFNVAKSLANEGKQIVLSTLALLEAPSEINELKKYINNGEFIVEANDLAAVQLAHEYRIPFVLGHAVNCYNAHTLNIFLKQGMTRWCMPVELSRDWLRNVMLECETLKIKGKFEVEVFAYGHMPLAYSARCFTARSEDRSKEQCETCCIKYANGKPVYSQETQQLFILNGIQTQSGSCYHLGNHLKEMHGLVDVVRLSPMDLGIFETVSQFKNNAQGQHPFVLDEKKCNGYWLNIEGMKIKA